MGCCEKKTERQNDFCPNEKEIKFLDYKSTFGDLLEIIDRTYNFFTYVPLIEFMNLLEFYTSKTSTEEFQGKFRNDFSSKDEFLSQNMAVEEFQSFIENKILKTSALNDILEKNNDQISIFKEAFIEIYHALLLKLGQNNPDKQFEAISKRDLISIGLLYCDSNNIDKIKVFFDIFKNENEEFVSTPELNEFLMCLFLIPSYCMISARKKTNNQHPDVPELKKDELLNMLKISELKDSQNLLQVFNNNFFQTKTNYTWEEFKALFVDKSTGFGWIFSSNGIRKKLEENNV